MRFDYAPVRQIYLQKLFKKSDCLAIKSFQDSVLITGHRNGALGLFDLKKSHQPCISSLQLASSICDIQPVSDTSPYFITSSLDSKLTLFDIRQLKASVFEFSGHVNQHQYLSSKILSQTVLISPGSDQFIRGWSIKSGQLLWQKAVKQQQNTPIYVQILQDKFNHSSPAGLLLTQDENLSFWSKS